MKKLKLLAIALLTSFCGFSQDTLYVNDDASGLNDGSTWANAYNLLHDALSNAAPGDQIWISEGTYHADAKYPGQNAYAFSIPVSDLSIYGGFQDGANATDLSQRNWNTYETHLTGDFTNGGGMSVRLFYINFKDNYIFDGLILENTSQNGWGNVIGLHDCQNVVIQNCILRNHNSGSDQGIIRVVAGSDLTLYNCLMTGNSGTYGSLGSVEHANSTLNYINCTMVDNVSNSRLFNNSSNNYINIYNSIIWNSGLTSGGVDILQNSLVDFTGSYPNPDLNTSFYPNKTSPAINSGDASYNSTTLDLAGEQRIMGSTIDIGAYEFTGTLFVDWKAQGNNDGSSWANAFTTIQAATAVAVAGDEVWVAEGTYFPSLNNDPGEYITLPSGVEMYGGFNATESLKSERNWDLHKTIIDGNIGNPAINTDNSRWLIRHFNSTGLVVDGFTLQNGFTNNYNTWENIYFSNTDAVLNNLIIQNNYSSRSGLFVTHGTCDIVVSNSLIKENEGTNGVLAVNNSSTSSFTYINCTILDNIVNGSACSGPNISFLNSILYNTGNAGSQASFDYCVVDFSTSSSTTFNNSSPNLSPNYYPTNSSPGLDAGDNNHNASTNDLGKNQRIQNNTIDIGAYEGFYDLISDFTVCSEEDAIFELPEGYESYEWSDGSTGSKIGPVDIGTTYTVTVTDVYGNVTIDQATITFDDNCVEMETEICGGSFDNTATFARRLNSISNAVHYEWDFKSTTTGSSYIYIQPASAVNYFYFHATTPVLPYNDSYNIRVRGVYLDNGVQKITPWSDKCFITMLEPKLELDPVSCNESLDNLGFYVLYGRRTGLIDVEVLATSQTNIGTAQNPNYPEFRRIINPNINPTRHSFNFQSFDNGGIKYNNSYDIQLRGRYIDKNGNSYWSPYGSACTVNIVEPWDTIKNPWCDSIYTSLSDRIDGTRTWGAIGYIFEAYQNGVLISSVQKTNPIFYTALAHFTPTLSPGTYDISMRVIYEDIYGNTITTDPGASCPITYTPPSPRLKSQNLGNKVSLSIYPNPSSGNFNISFEAEQYTQLIVRDLTGRLIKEINLTNEDQSNQLDLNNEAKGVYIVSVIGENGQENMKVTKQ